jgi:carbamoyl-phosphate synthase small subunit
MSMNPDGVFLSNGPGDPEPCDYAIKAIAELLTTDLPMFGICLGHQLLALASGAKTVKMKFGHHGANHPVQELASGRVMITSQNHGFAVDESTLPDEPGGHAPLAVRRQPAGRGAHRPAGVQLPGTSRGQPRTARPAPLFENFISSWCVACRINCGSCVPTRAARYPCQSVPT